MKMKKNWNENWTIRGNVTNWKGLKIVGDARARLEAPDAGWRDKMRIRWGLARGSCRSFLVGFGWYVRASSCASQDEARRKTQMWIFLWIAVRKTGEHLPSGHREESSARTSSRQPSWFCARRIIISTSSWPPTSTTSPASEQSSKLTANCSICKWPIELAFKVLANFF